MFVYKFQGNSGSYSDNSFDAFEFHNKDYLEDENQNVDSEAYLEDLVDDQDNEVMFPEPVRFSVYTTKIISSKKIGLLQCSSVSSFE